MKQTRKTVKSFVIRHLKDLDAEIVDDLAHELRSITPDVQTVSYESRPLMAMEWWIPAAVIIYVLKPYGDGFLKELGSEHAKGLSKVLASVFHRTREKNFRIEVPSNIGKS